MIGVQVVAPNQIFFNSHGGDIPAGVDQNWVKIGPTFLQPSLFQRSKLLRIKYLEI